MTLEEIDRRTALIVVDLQVGTTRNPLVHPVDRIVGSCVRLVSAFRERRLPVVLATSNGAPEGRTAYGYRDLPEDWADLVPELDIAETDVLVTRAGWSVFTGTDLHDHLRQLEVTEVIVCGLATSFGVESTARSGYDLGYHVVVATDAISDVSTEGHEGSLARVYPVLGQLATADEVIELLNQECFVDGG